MVGNEPGPNGPNVRTVEPLVALAVNPSWETNVIVSQAVDVG